MTMNGRVETVRVVNENDLKDVRTFKNIKLRLTEARAGPELTIIIASDEEIVLNLKRCSYIEESSEAGEIECIRDHEEKKKIILMDSTGKCEELFDRIRDCLQKQNGSRSPSPRRQSPSPRRRSPPPARRRSPSPGRRRSPSPVRRRSPSPPPPPKDNKKVTDLIKALNGGNAEQAAVLARELAREKQPVRFALDMNDESGDKPVPPPSAPVEKPLKRKVSIESFSIDNNNNQQYEVDILKTTTVKDLKQLVAEKAGIPPDHQCWYIDRELLPDTYKFDNNTRPKMNDDSVLILYITKP